MALLASLAVFPGSRLVAQVGHLPEHSPFRDVTTRQELTFSIGHFGGNEAKAGVGARAAQSLGFRFRSQLSGPLDLVFRTNYIGSRRLVIDPTKPDSIRRTGVIDYGIIETDLGLTLTLTGAKTWHGLAPWLGFGFGVTFATHSRTDPGGYKAATNFSIVPAIGTSLLLNRQLGLEFEIRDNTIRYEWPLAYFFPKDAAGNALPPAVLDPLTTRDKQMTHNFTLSAGLSYHFTF